MNGKMPSQNALNVPIKNGVRLPLGQTKNGAGGRTANTWQSLKLIDVVYKLSMVALYRYLSTFVQVSSTCVISKPRPMRQYVILRSFGKGLQIRETSHKPLVIGDHGGNLSLLQHNLRHPYSVGAFILLPRQALTAVFPKPLQHSRGESSSI